MQEIDDKEKNIKRKDQTLSDSPKIPDSLSSAPKNKFITTQNQQCLTDNNGQNNKMCTVIGVDKGSNSERNKIQIQRNLVSSSSKESENTKTYFNKMPRSRGMCVTKKVTKDYVVSLLAYS